MREQPTTTTVVAIIGANTLSEDILGRLLEREGYSVRHLDALPTHPMDELLDGVDILLVAPGLKDGMRGAFLKAMRSTPNAQHIPVFSLSVTFKEALLDELAVSVSWHHQLEQLVRQIAAALALTDSGGLEVDGATTA